MSPRSPTKAAFLDRDGVINVDHGYVHDPDNFELFPGVIEACKSLHEAGYKLIVVTNQAGIGRGYYTTTQFLEFTGWMEKLFRDAGAPITATYYCPHHPEMGIGQYRRVCEFRKPAPGMLLRAIDEHELDPSGSFFVGDKRSDIEAACSAGVRGYRVGEEGGYGSLSELVGELLPPHQNVEGLT
jgi:D-glycero-D-manno-heptose 1,7-bisphosphate phosphatase